MPAFSPTSADRLATCDERLQTLFNDVILAYDCTILVGHRCKEDQEIACARGLSDAPWPTSKHNSTPSCAVDVAPYPIEWENIARFKEFAQFVKERAQVLGIQIRWGGDFVSIKDYDHFELAVDPHDGIGGTNGSNSGSTSTLRT